MGLSIFLFVLFIFLTGLIAAAEVALVAISDAKVEEDSQLGNKKAIRIKAFTLNGQRYLANIQVLHLLILLILGVTFNTIITQTGLWTQGTEFIDVLLLIVWVFLTFTIYMIFGHMIPRRIAIKWTDQVAYKTVNMVMFFTFIISPVTFIFDRISKIVTKVLFGMKFDEGIRNVTEEEIRTLVAASGKKGVIDAQESEMIHNIFDFDETTVDQIMTHRTEISAIQINVTKHDVISFVTNEKFTRFPVYDNDIDDIVGTLHVKDLLKYIENNDEAFDLNTIVRKAYYIPDSKRIRELFYEMKKSKNHIAIVIDEYGGTAGIITIEDMIEEIVGNIFDEYDEIEEEVVQTNEHTYIIDGLASIDDIDDIIHANLPVDDYDTLSGFILGFLGRFPEEDEVIEFDYLHFTYKVLEIQDKVISKVLAIRHIETKEVDETPLDE